MCAAVRDAPAIHDDDAAALCQVLELVRCNDHCASARNKVADDALRPQVPPHVHVNGGERVVSNENFAVGIHRACKLRGRVRERAWAPLSRRLSVVTYPHLHPRLLSAREVQTSLADFRLVASWEEREVGPERTNPQSCRIALRVKRKPENHVVPYGAVEDPRLRATRERVVSSCGTRASRSPFLQTC